MVPRHGGHAWFSSVHGGVCRADSSRKESTNNVRGRCRVTSASKCNGVLNLPMYLPRVFGTNSPNPVASDWPGPHHGPNQGDVAICHFNLSPICRPGPQRLFFPQMQRLTWTCPPRTTTTDRQTANQNPRRTLVRFPDFDSYQSDLGNGPSGPGPGLQANQDGTRHRPGNCDSGGPVLELGSQRRRAN